MLYKYEHTKHERLRSWRRYQQERVVKNRLTNNSSWHWWLFNSFETGGVEYGRCTWVDLLSDQVAYKSRTSHSYAKSGWDYENKYDRTKYKKQTKRLLWEEGID